MKHFRIEMTAVDCPSDWNISKVRAHLRKTFTQSEVDAAIITEIPPLARTEEQSTNPTVEKSAKK